jgi:hypothetical protein
MVAIDAFDGCDLGEFMRTAHRFAVAIAVAWALGVSPALAGDVPTSAYAQSLLVEPELLESDGLLFVHPQRAAATNAQMFALGATDVEGIGGVFRVGSGRLFVLSQDAQLGSDYPLDLEYTVFPSSGDSSPAPLLQLGYANRWGPVRWGGAIRGGHASTRALDVFDDDSDEMETTRRFWQGVVGWGATSSRGWSTDFHFALARTDVEATTRDLGNGVTERHVDTVDRLQIEAGTHCRVPVGSRSSLTLAGRYRDTSRQTRTRLVDGATESFTGVFDYSHEWSVGLLVAHESDYLGRIRGFGHYRNFRGPTVSIASAFDSGSTSRFNADVVRFGVSMERAIPYECTLLAGLANAFSIQESLYWRVRTGSIRENKDVRETLSQSFGLGLRRSYGRIHGTGSMRTDLAIADPFLAVDLSFDLD